ncbi:MAG: tryptophan--tRNA ligase [Candidatus Kerfeldbacteria bacterium CG_4_10_14_0_8_um_filter_42_10]|uniref:Tryptophan--tRNA ligase n=1 Tax=Candidatus Kerfeldbacteria bacterium CG_4_10_14_0_8_um_filter_42_10 TaxID=2014248 RepID=A0A2M7RHD5_9BACT|nr:MAG: tryptophan--tRNA ligase [Candidatus Kerfeldbacteria bacterium CG_4_10_14_0_8_um_filter_42_10]
MKSKKIIFSGIKPSGAIHLGNYFGAIRQWIELQKEYQGIFCIVDYHAITVDYNPKEMQARILGVAADYIAAGIDPKKSIIFVQSQVPEHTELAWILNTIIPIGELQRMTQYKEKAQKQQSVNAGLLNYPVLMASDILLYKAIGVPVGDDQVQHVELTRTIARIFNRKFGFVFPEPKVILSRGSRIMSLADPNKKMSKDLGEKHYIALSDSPAIIKEKIAKAVTDVGPQPTGGKKSPGVTNLFELLELMGDSKNVEKFEREYKQGKLHYQELKEILADDLIKYLTEFRKKREELLKDSKKVKKILEEGAKEAQKIAKETLKEVKEKMGLI